MKDEGAEEEQLPPSDWAPLDLSGPTIDLRTMMPRWQQMLANIKRLFRERYPDHPEEEAGDAPALQSIGGA